MIEKFSLPGVIIYLNVTLKARNFPQTTFNEGEHVYVTLANGEEEYRKHKGWVEEGFVQLLD